MAFFALYLVVSFLALGFLSFGILKKQFPDKDPLHIVNSLLIFAVLGDLIFRYLMQKLPVMNIKPMLALPIRKSKLVHYVLGKSAFSFFNVMGLFFYIPFSIILIREGYGTASVLGWLATISLLILAINYLNFLINKNNIAFWVIASLTVALIAAQMYDVINVGAYSKQIFNAVYEQSLFALVPLLLIVILYYLNFKLLSQKIYLDDAVANKVKEAKTADLSWADRLGDSAPFIKNDLRLIWRNKAYKNGNSDVIFVCTIWTHLFYKPCL